MTGFLPGLSDPVAYSERLLACSGALAFDVGANGGWLATKLADRFETVVAFEPAAESFAALELTAQHRNIVAVPMAVTDHTGTVRLREADVTVRWGELVTGASMPDWGELGSYREVPAISLDDAVVAYGPPDLVKVDTEGHEVPVLWGAQTLIAEVRPQWWIEVHAAEHEQPIRAALDGYEVELVRHPGYPPDSDAWARHFYMVATP